MYRLKYCGYVKVTKPTRNLGQEQRSTLAREAMKLITGVVTDNSTLKLKEYLSTMSKENSGEVEFLAKPMEFQIRMLDGEIIAQHQKDNISFVSIVEDHLPHYFTYCAKDRTDFRACYVFEIEDPKMTPGLNDKMNQIFA